MVSLSYIGCMSQMFIAFQAVCFKIFLGHPICDIYLLEFDSSKILAFIVKRHLIPKHHSHCECIENLDGGPNCNVLGLNIYRII